MKLRELPTNYLVNLLKKDGSKCDLESVPDIEGNIQRFIELVRTNKHLRMFMNDLLISNILLNIFSQHRQFFANKGFEERPTVCMFKPEDMPDMTIKTLISDYENNLETLSELHSSKLEETYLTYFSGAVKVFSTICEHFVRKGQPITRMNISRIKKSLAEEANLKVELDERDKKEIKNAFRKLSRDGIDIEILMTLSIIRSLNNGKTAKEKIVERLDTLKIDYEEYKLNFKKISDRGIIRPISILGICLNEDHILQTPYINLQMPSKLSNQEKACPQCNKDLLDITFMSFIPEISKKLMDQSGFLPCILAWVFEKEQIFYRPGVTKADGSGKEANETDFIALYNEKQSMVEVKVFDCIKAKNRTIAQNILNAINQMSGNISKWCELDIEFSERYLLVNYSKDQIEKAKKEEPEVQVKLTDNKINLFSSEKITSLAEHIKAL